MRQINHLNFCEMKKYFKTPFMAVALFFCCLAANNVLMAQTTMTQKMLVTIDGVTQTASLDDNVATAKLVENLQEGPVTVTLNSSGGFEIWGSLGFSLPTDNRQINAQPGDLVLYNGSNICMFYGSNSWSYTPLGKFEGLNVDQLKDFLKAGQSNISVTLSLPSAEAVTNNKTLVVYYSYTGNCQQIVESLTSQIEVDVLRIYPADKTQRYEANNYALGTQLLNAIQADPYNADSYPAIDPVNVNLANYENFIIVTPLWWSQMAAILQTYLFHHGAEMAGKNVGLIVSSHSSGISGVVRDAKRLVPEAKWLSENLWINASNHSNRDELIRDWLVCVDYESLVKSRPVGDLNDDGMVDVSDVSLLIDMVLGKVERNFNLADFNVDSSIDVTDVSLLIDIVLGK